MVSIKEIIVKTVGKGTKDDPRRVNLPSYQIKEFLPDNKVRILVPDDEIDKNGKLCKEKIRQKYIGQKWDHQHVCDDCICQ